MPVSIDFAREKAADIPEHVAALCDEVTSGQFIDLGAVNARIKAKVEVVQQTRLTEVGQFVTPIKEPLVADIDLVLEQ